MTAQTKPQIRFPSFKDEYVSVSVKDIAKNGLSNGVFNDPNKVGSGYRLVNVKDMYSDKPISYDSLTQVDIEAAEFERNQVVNGDIFFTRSSLVREGIAVSNIFLGSQDDVTFDGHLIKLSPNSKDYHPTYINYNLKTDTARRQIVARGQTGTMTTIGQAQIAEISLFIPSITEQEKIADFLSAVDEKIALLEKKKELMEKYKKGVMQQIFRQELQFDAESSGWAEVRLGEIATITTGKKDVNQGNPDGKFPFFTCAKEHTFSNEYSFSGEAILIAGNAEVGLCKYYDGEFEAYQRTYVLQNFEHDGRFIFRYLSHFFRAYALGLKQTGAMSYIKLGMLEDYSVPIPSETEQGKITEFLDAIDQKIELNSKVYNDWLVFKKGLLQQMFV